MLDLSTSGVYTSGNNFTFIQVERVWYFKAGQDPHRIVDKQRKLSQLNVKGFDVDVSTAEVKHLSDAGIQEFKVGWLNDMVKF